MKRYILLLALIYPAFVARTQLNPIPATVPFLNIDINSKTAGMGETGAVSTGISFVPGKYQNPSLLVKFSKTTVVNASCLLNYMQKSRKLDFVKVPKIIILRNLNVTKISWFTVCVFQYIIYKMVFEYLLVKMYALYKLFI